MRGKKVKQLRKLARQYAVLKNEKNGQEVKTQKTWTNPKNNLQYAFFGIENTGYKKYLKSLKREQV